jgi:hypothetical protein
MVFINCFFVIRYVQITADTDLLPISFSASSTSLFNAQSTASVVLEGFKYLYAGSVSGSICEAASGGFVSLTRCTVIGGELVTGSVLLSAYSGEVSHFIKFQFFMYF